MRQCAVDQAAQRVIEVGAEGLAAPLHHMLKRLRGEVTRSKRRQWLHSAWGQAMAGQVGAQLR